VKVDCVQPQIDLNLIKSCEFGDTIPVLDVDIVRNKRQTQGFRMRHHFRTQQVVTRRIVSIILQLTFYVTPELIVLIVDGREKAEVGEKAQENRETRNCPPAGESMRGFLQNSRSDSLPANNSSQISPCSVHSGITDPEIWTSSTFNVPWP